MQLINLTKEPDMGNGFIYVLSHPQMVNLYKIGATHTNMAECISSLNETGLPKSYIAERIYEIDARHLREIELEINKQLTRTGQFNQKFFDGELDKCIEIVEDAIFQITNDLSNELIKDAINRSLEKLRLEEVEKNQLLELQELRKIEAEKIRFRLETANEMMDQRREQWLKDWIARNGDGIVDSGKMVDEALHSKWDRYVMRPMGVIFGLAFAILIAGITAPIGPVVLIVFLIWFFIKRSQEKSSSRYSLTTWAYMNHPTVTIETLEKYEKEFKLKSTP
jgi:hypothetical protein